MLTYTPTQDQINTVTRHYLEALLWTMPGDDENENPGDDYDYFDIPEVTIDKAKAICTGFINLANEEGLFQKAMACFEDGYGMHPDAGSAEAAFGQDLALTINGHGVGFWDRKQEGMPEDVGDALTVLCKRFDSKDLYIGDDGLLYLE